MSIDDLLRAVTDFAEQSGVSRPRRLRIEFDDARDLIDVPILAGKKRKVYTTCEPAGEEDEITGIVLELIDDAETRLTTGMIYQQVEDRYKDATGMSRRNVQRALAKLIETGEVVNHHKDPKDGMGRGYGMRHREAT